MILHIGRNDLLKGISIDSFVNFIGNVEHMVQKCRGLVVKLVFLSDIIYTKRIAWSILNDVHDRLLSLCQRFEINYIDNRNIREAHLFKDSLRLLDTDTNNPRGTLFILNKLKIKNINRSVIGRLNIKIFKYSLSSKFGQLKLIIEKNIDILVIAETTIDSTNLSC